MRSRFAHFFKTTYFSELEVSLPVGDKLWAPLFHYDSYDSFSEIFIQGEYGEYVPEEPAFDRVLDIGAHFGYFSLWLQARQPDRPLSALLIEPDDRASEAVESLIRRNRLENQFRHVGSAIGPAEKSTVSFHSRPFMASSAYGDDSGKEKSVRKNIVSDEGIQALFPPPYDSIKIDVEGSEWDFLRDYGQVLSHTKRLVLEWHSWHAGGGGAEQIRKRLRELGFRVEKESPGTSAVGRTGEIGLMSAVKRDGLA